LGIGKTTAARLALLEREGGADTRNRATQVAREAFRIPLRAASACGLGNQLMKPKGTKTVTWNVEIIVHKCLLALVALIALFRT